MESVSAFAGEPEREKNGFFGTLLYSYSGWSQMLESKKDKTTLSLSQGNTKSILSRCWGEI